MRGPVGGSRWPGAPVLECGHQGATAGLHTERGCLAGQRRARRKERKPQRRPGRGRASPRALTRPGSWLSYPQGTHLGAVNLAVMRRTG